MLSLANNIISNSYQEGVVYDRTLPYQGSYVYLEDAFRISNPNAGVSPVTVHSYNDISFDDSVIESFSFEGNTATVYSEINNNQATSKYTVGLLEAGDTVTLTGNILRYDNGEVWDGDDTSVNGNVDFVLNSSGDSFKVFIDIQNTDATIAQINRDKVDSNGAFSVSKTLVGDATRFTITANSIADGGVMVPGVRISNLTLTKS